MKQVLLVLFAILWSAWCRPLSAQADAAEGAGPGGAVRMLRLFEGGILWGSLESHSAEGLAFRRLDNGGLVRLDWSRLDPVQADEFLQRFGYVDETSDEVMTEADRLVLNDGSELIGKIVNRTDTAIWLKTARSTIPVPKLRLRAGATTVQVPALDVYTRDELYSQELVNLDPADARSQLELGLFCERIFAFDQGVEHLERASELDPELEPEVLANHLARQREKQGNQEQIEVLREVDHLRAKGKFDQALQLTSSFPERFPSSPLTADAARKQIQVERSREQALRDRVASLWHHTARKLVRDAAQDPELTFEGAVAWVDGALEEELLTRVHAELARTVSAELEPEDVRRYFDEREGGRWQKATYSMGTWLLGEGEALAGLEQPSPDTGAKSERDDERARMAERIRRYLKNQEVIRSAKSSGGAGDQGEQQEFWQGWSSNGRAGWLLAYYAENGGAMQLREPIFRDCTQCGGSGVREVINTGSARSNSSRGGAGGSQNSSNTSVIKCPTCKHIGKWRTASFR